MLCTRAMSLMSFRLWGGETPHHDVTESAVHAPGNWSHPSEASVLLHWLIRLLHSLWCLIPSWLCPSSGRRIARPVMNIQRSAYLTGLSLLSKPLGTILQPQKPHSMDLLLSFFVSFTFLYSLSLSLLSLSLWAFAKHIDPPIQEFICCSS